MKAKTFRTAHKVKEKMNLTLGILCRVVTGAVKSFQLFRVFLFPGFVIWTVKWCYLSCVHYSNQSFALHFFFFVVAADEQHSPLTRVCYFTTMFEITTEHGTPSMWNRVEMILFSEWIDRAFDCPKKIREFRKVKINLVEIVKSQ